MIYNIKIKTALIRKLPGYFVFSTHNCPSFQVTDKLNFLFTSTQKRVPSESLEEERVKNNDQRAESHPVIKVL